MTATTMFGVATTAAPASASSLPPGATVNQEALTEVAVTNLTAAESAATPSKTGTAQQAPLGQSPTARSSSRVSAGARRAALPAASAGSTVNYGLPSGNASGEHGTIGITAPENAAVNGIDVSPPDQGLAVGPSPAGTVAVDFVNQAVGIFSATSGKSLSGAVAASALFGLPSTAFLSDPRVYYDAPDQRWLFTMFTAGSGETGAQSTSTQYIAVSQTSDVFGYYTVYGLDTTDATMAHCPCFGDFDQVGLNSDGFYIATNEFSNSGQYFNGAVVYAMSKQELESAASSAGTATPSPTPVVDAYHVPTDAFGQTYHLSPSATPAGGTYAPETEYFVESNGDNIGDRNLEVYAMTGTNALAQGGVPGLSSTLVGTEGYEQPPNAVQKIGPIPIGVRDGASEGQLQTDFDAVQEVTYTGGKLYAELSTALPQGTGDNAGVAWVILSPTVSNGTVSASVANQGYLKTTQNFLYPVIGVNGSGRGYLAMADSGPQLYPSAVYTTFGSSGPGSSLYEAAAGDRPLDDFTCYPPFSAGSCRYGDYSMATYWSGRIYMATEYVPPTPGDNQTDWGTYVWSAPTP